MLVFVNINCTMAERKPTDERKEEVFEAALEIIYKKGKEDLTIRRIAEEVDISEAAIYRHFENKKDIIIQLAEKIFTQNRLGIEGKDFRKPRQLLESLIKSIFSSLEENPYSTAFLFHEELFREYPEIQKMFQKHREKKIQRIEKLVKNAQEAGKIVDDVDPEIFARIFTGSIRMSVLEWRNKDFSYSLEEEAENLTTELSKILEKDE